MARIHIPLLVLLASLLTIPTAEAGPIVYFDTYRSLDASGQLLENTTTGEWDAFLPVQNGLASHISDITQTGITAAFNLSKIAFAGEGDVNNSARLATSFALDRPYSASLDFSLQAREAAHTEGFLFNQQTGAMLAQVILDGSISRLQYEGVLDPGVYSFFLLSRVGAPAGPYFGHGVVVGELALEPFAPVPEPATMTLFGAGLAAAYWRRRRQ